MLLLKILALEPMNGFAVSQRLKRVSGDVLQVSDGSLLPGPAQVGTRGLDHGRVENVRTLNASGQEIGSQFGWMAERVGFELSLRIERA